jgi:hypothetical protein
VHVDGSVDLGSVLGETVPNGSVEPAWDCAFRVSREESVEVYTGA